MTDAEIRAVEQAATSPAQRLIVALAAVHAACRAAIRDLTLDDLDLPNRRITIGGHRQRLGELTYRAPRAWLGHRRATWPRTPNRHVLIYGKTALGSRPASRSFLTWNLQRHGVSIERIRRDRVLHEALTARADPLHLALAFAYAEGVGGFAAERPMAGSYRYRRPGAGNRVGRGSPQTSVRRGCQAVQDSF